jgi:hypothetical protein
MPEMHLAVDRTRDPGFEIAQRLLRHRHRVRATVRGVTRYARLAVCVLLMMPVAAPLVATLDAQAPIPDCRDPETCRQLALDARARGAYETFHDLAWRAVQTGRPNDPDLMYLLARAQALSGRRRDALIMLRRLAEAGFKTEVATHEDFRRVRELAGWREVDTLAERAASESTGRAAAAAPLVEPAVPPPPAIAKPAPVPSLAAAPSPAAPSRAAAAAAPAPPPPAAPVPTPPPLPVTRAVRIEPAEIEEAARFSIAAFDPAGLAYDAVSRRFLLGDVSGRRLIVNGEGSERASDLVRADAAGFDDIAALAIDSKRGTLWVASTGTGGGSVHRLQLISGRVLEKVTAPSGTAATRLTDLAIAPDGMLLVLDTGASRVLVLRPGASTLEPLIALTVPDPASIAVAEDGRTAFVAHRDGIERVDLQSRRSGAVAAAKGVELGRIDRLQMYRGALLGVQAHPDASRSVVRLPLNRERRMVTATEVVDVPPPQQGPTFLTVSGDDVYYLVAERGNAGSSAVMNVLVRRLRLPD